jgi:hypothetical protein|tara:strand:- start:203 stop:1021 length:819 start_codon:yes stop_codon:yes gene_type:complete
MILSKNELSKNEFIGKEEIKALAPSVFTKERNANTTTEHYVHIPTEKVIDDMATLGWNVVDAKQVQARKNEGYQQHMVVFGNNDLVVEGQDGDTVMPRILMTNSHDGKNSFKFQAGLYRFVCSNGLVIADAEFASMKIRHMGYDLSELTTVINEMVEKLPLTVECMNKLKAKILSEEEKVAFAKEALQTRISEKQLSTYTTENIMELLEPTREEDNGDDMWSVYNIVQEKVIHGMFDMYGVSGKVRKARKIKNFKQDTKVNQELYNLALNYA